MQFLEDSLSRRRFVRLGRDVLVLVGLSTIFPISKYLFFKDNRTVVERFAKNKIKLNNIWQRVGDTRFWMRLGERGPEAIWATCTHLGCEVHFDSSMNIWICPCHGSKYSSQGKPIAGPAKFPLRLVKVEEQNDDYLLKPPN